jgi:hypothetical protein
MSKPKLALTVVWVLVGLFTIGGSSAMAETGKKALILGSSVSGGSSSLEATRASNLGFTVTVVSDATWSSMTAAQFADYQLIVVGDPDGGVPEVVSQKATALSNAVMDRAGSNTKAGNRLLIGTDPFAHSFAGGNKLINTGINFAGVQNGASGLYLTISDFDDDYDNNGTPDVQDKLLPLLTIDPTPGWTQNQSPPCGGDVSLISNAAQFASLTSNDLRGWGCSVHESFPSFPSDWNPLAIATDTPTAPTCGNDVDTGTAQCGEAYLLIAGSGITSGAPNLDLNPQQATNPVGSQHTLTAKVTNDNGSPRSGVTVEFVVTGANAGAAGACVPANCKSDANGQVRFTYTGRNQGQDTINATITINGSTQTATASKTWTAVQPPPPGGPVWEAAHTDPASGCSAKVQSPYLDANQQVTAYTKVFCPRATRLTIQSRLRSDHRFDRPLFRNITVAQQGCLAASCAVNLPAGTTFYKLTCPKSTSRTFNQKYFTDITIYAGSSLPANSPFPQRSRPSTLSPFCAF